MTGAMAPARGGRCAAMACVGGKRAGRWARAGGVGPADDRSAPRASSLFHDLSGVRGARALIYFAATASMQACATVTTFSALFSFSAFCSLPPQIIQPAPASSAQPLPTVTIRVIRRSSAPA